MKKAWKPKIKKSDKPTLTGTPPLGYLISHYCPKCGKHLFSFYEGDLKRPDYKFKVSQDWNYCSKCGTLLDLSEWKNPEMGIKGAEDEIKLED